MSVLVKMYEIMPERWKQIYRAGKIMKYQKYTESGELIYMPQWLAKKKDGTQYFSQQGQDWVVRNIIYPDKKDGVFIDIGGNHPEKLNNTLCFEKMGWHGVAYEPQPTLNALWKDTRKTKCYQMAVGREGGQEVEFEEIGENPTDSNNVLSGVAGKNSKNTYKVKMTCLSDILKDNNLKHVDYLSLDVEGYELEVLKGLDLKAADICCISIEVDEHEKGYKEKRQFLYNSGYRLVARLQGDDIWVKTNTIR